MSMPNFPPVDPDLNRENALNMILQSIALEEAALSHIINAEGEKIQAAVASVQKKCCDADMQKLLEINRSVHDVLEQVRDIQMLLKSKMSRALEYMPRPEPPHSKPEPIPKCCPPEKIRACKCVFCEPATSIFKVFRSDWTKNAALNLSRLDFCDDDIQLQRNHCGESLLVLSKNKYSVEFNLKLQKEAADHVFLECKICENEKEAENIIFSTDEAILTGGFIHTADNHSGKFLVSMKLHSKQKIKIDGGIVTVTKESS
jgi:hypothetical protein